jgi:hypothetical protein
MTDWTDTFQRPCAECGAPKSMVLTTPDGGVLGILTRCEECVNKALVFNENPFKKLLENEEAKRK